MVAEVEIVVEEALAIVQLEQALKLLAVEVVVGAATPCEHVFVEIDKEEARVVEAVLHR